MMLSVQHNAAMNIAVTCQGKPSSPHKLKELQELRKIVRNLNQECFSRKIQLQRQVLESDEKLKEIEEKLDVATTEVEKIEATRDAWKAEWDFAKHNNFWKRVHRKHIMEDLTYLKKHQKDCFKKSKDILIKDIQETSNGQNISFWHKTKKFFTNLFPQSTGAKRRKERRSRRNEKFEEIIRDLENGVTMVDELAVLDYCSYTRAQFRNKD